MDTAGVTAKGESERITGRLIAADRSRWVLATKLASPSSNGPVGQRPLISPNTPPAIWFTCCGVICPNTPDHAEVSVL